MNQDSVILALLARLTAENIALQQRVAQLEAERPKKGDTIEQDQFSEKRLG
jgi:hypothetical protein